MRDEKDLLSKSSNSTLHPSSLIPHPSSLIPHAYVAAILLAAGRSRRMGAFKPLLPFGDKTVIESCIDNLRAGGCGTIVVVAGHRAEEMHERLASLPVSVVVNAEVGSEMGVSIARGAEQLPENTENIFVALVDQPAVGPEVMKRLLEERARTGARLVVPTHEGRGGHPVLLDGSLREELKTLDPERGLRSLFDAHSNEVLRVAVSSPYVTRDMDEWDDYRALHREIFGIEPPGAQESGAQASRLQ